MDSNRTKPETPLTMPLMRENPLGMLINIIEFPVKKIETRSLVKVLLMFIYLLNIFILIEQYKEGDYNKFVELVIVHLMQQWGAHLGLLSLIKLKLLTKAHDIFHNNLWDHSVFNLKTQKTIKYECRKAILQAVIIFCVFACMYMSFNTIFTNDICTQFTFFERHSLQLFGIFTVNICYISIVYGFTSPNAYFIYVCIQIKIQILLLNEHLESLLDTDLNFDLLHDEDYQNFVNKKLKIFVNHHLNVLSVYEKVLEVKRIYLFVYLMCAVTVVVSIAYFVVSGIHPQSNFRMYIIIMGYFAILLVFSTISQQLKDEFDELLVTLNKLPWMYWNKSNRLSLLIIMSRLAIPFEVQKIVGFCDVSHIFLLKMFRTSYTIVTMVWNLKNHF